MKNILAEEDIRVSAALSDEKDRVCSEYDESSVHNSVKEASRFSNSQVSGAHKIDLNYVLNKCRNDEDVLTVLTSGRKEDTFKMETQPYTDPQGQPFLKKNGKYLTELEHAQYMLRSNGSMSLGDRFAQACLNANAPGLVKNAAAIPGSQPTAFQQALTFVEPYMYMALYHPINFHQAFGVYTSGGFSNQVQFQSYEGSQGWGAVSDGQTQNDEVAVSPVQTQVTSHTYSAHIKFNVIQLLQIQQDLENATTSDHYFSNYNALRAKMQFLGYFMWLKINECTWLGDLNTGVKGVMTHPGIPRFQPGTPLNWSNTSSSTQIFDDLRKIITSVSQATSRARQADSLIVSNRLYTNVLQYRPLSQTFPNTTIINWFREMRGEGINFLLPTPALDGAGINGNEVAIAYDMNRLEQVAVVPAAGFAMPSQNDASNIILNFGFRFGGFAALRQKSLMIADNIQI